MQNQISELFNAGEAARYLRVTPGTLSWWRHMGRGPAYIKVGRRVLYRRSTLDEFLAGGVRLPEGAAS